MKKSTKISLLIVAVVLFLLVGLYMIGHTYFSDRFYANTSIGDVEVSGMTPSEASAKLENQLLDSKVTFTENEQEIGLIPLSSFATIDQTQAIVEESLADQENNHWFLSFFRPSDYEASVGPQLNINDDQLKEALSSIGINNEDRQASEDAKIAHDDDQGYYIQEAVEGNQVDLEKVKESLQASSKVDLANTYITPQKYADHGDLQEQMEKINQIAQTQVTLTIEDNEVTIPESNIRQWIQVNDQGELGVDKKAIHDYLGELNLEYATYSKERKLDSTYSGEVTVEPKILGWHIDRESETEQIASDLLAAKNVKRDPAIEGNNYGIGLGFGPDYIEVDIDKQKLVIHKGGEIVFETDVITGRPGSETPTGASYVWNKETGTTLRGFNIHIQEDYETPVAYWVAITDDNLIGIHDASWQYDFGGDSRFSHGSLGCINISPAVMDKIFNLAEMEMPVAVF